VYVKVIHQLQAFFYTEKHVTQSHCHSRASCS